MAHVLADSGLSGLFFWAAVLLVLLIAALGGVLLIKRWLANNESDSTQAFTLSDLRRMHQQGQLTGDQYEKLRSQLIGGVAGKPPAGPSPTATATGTPTPTPRKVSPDRKRQIPPIPPADRDGA